MSRHLIGLVVVGMISMAGTAAAQRPAPPARPARPAPPAPPALFGWPDQAPLAPLPPLPPLPAQAPLAPLAPMPPLPPAFDFNFDHDFNFDFNFDHDFKFDFDFPHVDVQIDRDAIRESARAAAEAARNIDRDAIRESARVAAESARAFAFNFAQAGAGVGNGVGVGVGGPFGRSAEAQNESRADNLYRQARESIDRGRYDRALPQLDQLIALGGSRVDAGLYWKGYSQFKQGQRDQALTTLADLQKRFTDSRWLKDAKALEVEVRQASGQAVSPDSQNDEEIKLLALRGLMQSDPDRVVPMIEKMLAGNTSIKMQENALFVLSQSRSAKAREIIAGVARNGNPDMQLRAIRYLGAAGGTDNRQLLDDVYRSTNDTAIKRAVLRGYMAAGDRAKLLAVAKSDSSADIRAEAIQQLGGLRATAELSELYQSESSVEIRRRILQGLAAGGAVDKLIEVARTEKDPELRRSAIRGLGNRGDRDQATDVLKSIYTSDSNVDVKREVINALASHDRAATLVELARVEKDPALKRELVQRLTNMKSKEATDYLLELLK